ncbi:hypothetical protein [Micromonospora sp. NBRC 101691]|uniref:hypothetical protein n=1 Tax=Micromonospora TaxID=1873 RepID=UPI0024A18735|nr:hypothetical protein [Micromonospora sp. NBRC 101691]GLY24586.1 hypothetical protein Misp04_43180 [Micromonospora sp. NBRC 101691]
MLHAPRHDAPPGGDVLGGASWSGALRRTQPAALLAQQGRPVRPPPVASLMRDATSAVITIAGLVDPVACPGDLLRLVAGTGTTVEMVTVLPAFGDLADLIFVVPSRWCATVTGILAAAQPAIAFRQVRCEHVLFRLTLAGPGVGCPAGRWSDTLRRARVPLLTSAVVPDRVEAMCRGVGMSVRALSRLRAAFDAPGAG